MSSITAQQQTVRQRVLSKLWVYVDDNFHKFTQAEKLKICVVLLSKSMPNIIEGTHSITKFEKVQMNGNTLEVTFAANANRIGQAVRDAGQAVTIDN